MMDARAVSAVLAEDLGWMAGNTFLAFVAVLLAWTIGAEAHRARCAAVTLVIAGGAIGMIRARNLDSEVGVVAVAVVMTGAAIWAWRARRGDRWARWLAFVGIVAFTPNAPYVLTDLYHYQQDLRATGNGLGAALLFSVLYGWFTIVAVSAWILLLDLGRGAMRRHRPGWSRRTALVAVGIVCAFGVYLGRIERFHSWHPLKDPAHFLGRVGTALTSIGPLVFTAVMAVVIVGSGWLGLALLDRARRHGTSGGQLVTALAWLMSALLLAGATTVARVYDAYGVAIPRQSTVAAASCLAIAIVVGAFASARVAQLVGAVTERVNVYPGHGREGTLVPRIAAIGALVVPVLGILLVWLASSMWWAQHRGLCDYAPAVQLHGDWCG
ncbi:MAG: hypothetical protein JWO69_1248 [Thermoleophilia bacterium]|nr:hypothetical protein [Thermoleophilia bacterium]